jgi:hypothetical protein
VLQGAVPVLEQAEGHFCVIRPDLFLYHVLMVEMPHAI